jgi:hypothetical protein
LVISGGRGLLLCSAMCSSVKGGAAVLWEQRTTPFAGGTSPLSCSDDLLHDPPLTLAAAEIKVSVLVATVAPVPTELVPHVEVTAHPAGGGYQDSRPYLHRSAVKSAAVIVRSARSAFTATLFRLFKSTEFGVT